MGIWLKKRDFKPYYKNQSSKERSIAHLLKTTKWSYAKIGKKLRVSDHSVTDTNKKLKIRQRKPKLSLFRPTNETWKANRGAEIGRAKTKLKKKIVNAKTHVLLYGESSKGKTNLVKDLNKLVGKKRLGRPKIRRKTEKKMKK